jgi:16S rRNA processing protein RimM
VAAPADLVEVGRVVAAHGLKGWIKVQPYSAQADALRSVKQWWLARPMPEAARGGAGAAGQAGHSAAGAAQAPSLYRELAAYAVAQWRPQGDMLAAQLTGVASRDQAEALRGCVLLAERSAFPPPEDGEYYWVDLIGCAFYSDAEGEPCLLGRVEDVLDNGAHAILRVRRLEPGAAGGEPRPLLDAKGRPRETLIPFVGAHVRAVDLAARRIDGDWPMDD